MVMSAKADVQRTSRCLLRANSGHPAFRVAPSSILRDRLHPAPGLSNPTSLLIGKQVAET